MISQRAGREALPCLWRRHGWDGVNEVFIKECLFQDLFKFHFIESQTSYPKNSCLKQKKMPAISSAVCKAALHHGPVSLNSYRAEWPRVFCHPFRGCFSDTFILPFQILGPFALKITVNSLKQYFINDKEINKLYWLRNISENKHIRALHLVFFCPGIWCRVADKGVE